MWVACPNPNCENTEIEISFSTSNEEDGQHLEYELERDCSCNYSDNGIPDELDEIIRQDCWEYEPPEPSWEPFWDD